MTDEPSAAVSEPTWDAWPRCPRCARPRQCVCPICETAGVEFPLADYQAAPAPLRPTRDGDATVAEPSSAESLPLLRCPICDEVFPPRFYHVCHACGHDFRDGISPSDPTRNDVSPRTVATVVAIAAVVGLAFAYFWWLLRQ